MRAWWWGLLGWVACGTGMAGEAPFICAGSPETPQKFKPVVEDLATGNLPIPDYQSTAIKCETWDWMTQQGKPGAHPAPPKSTWLEAERARYAEILAKQPADILVVPFQIQGYGLDRIERAVMAADLAYAIGDAGGLKVADPFLSALALGEGERRFDPLAVQTLANKIGARKVLLAYVGHDFKRAFTLTVKLQDVGAALTAKPWQRDWRSVPFTNEQTPAYVFHQMLPTVLKELPLGLDPKRSAAARLAPTPENIATPPLALVSATNKSGADIATMSLLAALLPTAADRARERLFERVLLTAIRANSAKPEQRFFEAYALLNLYRRPVALARIDGANGHSFAALRALLDGNLPAARSATSKVENPLEQLLLEFELRDLDYRYGSEEPAEPTAIASVFPAREVMAAWIPLLMARIEHGNKWFLPKASVLKRALDRAFPSKDFSLDSLATGNAALRGTEPDDVAIDLASTRHARQAAASLQVSPCCRTQDLRSGSWDLLWLLEGVAQERVNRSVEGTIFLQGSPAAALAKIARYEPLFKGHPRMTGLGAYAAILMSHKGPDDERAGWESKGVQAASAVIQWSPGQNATASRAAETLGTRGSRIWLDVYGYDFPRRSDWPSSFVNDHLTEALPVKVALLTEALDFSTSDITPLSDLLNQAGHTARAELGERFAGNPRRPQPPPATKPEDRLAATVVAAKTDPSQNLTLGYQLLISDRPLEEALTAFLAYPAFKKGDARDQVALSNDAYEAGSLFFWLGRGEMARPLYKIAADLQTGSDASMASEQRLSLLSGDFLAAAQMARDRSESYSSSYAQRDYLSLLHAFGKHEAAWNAFAQLRAGQGEPALWTSVLVGHRMQKLDQAAVRAWLNTPEIRQAKVTTQLFASYYALLWNSTDRMPPADLGAFIAELEGKPVAFIDAGGVARPHPFAPGSMEIVQPTFVPPDAAKTPRLPEGTKVKSQRAYFADAYSAVVRGEHAKAVERFGAMAKLYAIDGAPLAYFSYAAAKTGDPLQVERYVATPDPWLGYDVLLSRSFFAASRGKVDESHRLLTLAFRNKPFLGERPVDIDYQFAQACEWLHRDTKDPRFAAMLLDWARRYQAIQPTMAWSYAVQYQYETNPAARTRALAMTLYLDPLSERIAKASKADVEKARTWFAANNPFRLTGDDVAQPAPAVML